MKNFFLVFAAFTSFTFSATAQSDVIIESDEISGSHEVISIQNSESGETMAAVVYGEAYAEGQLVGFRKIYGPGQAHWGNAKFILVEIFPIEDPTQINDALELARVGHKGGHITFGGGTTRVD